MIKYEIKRKIVNCEKIESVTSHDLYPLPCHKLSHFLRPPSPEVDSCVTYFMDGPTPLRPETRDLLSSSSGFINLSILFNILKVIVFKLHLMLYLIQNVFKEFKIVNNNIYISF